MDTLQHRSTGRNHVGMSDLQSVNGGGRGRAIVVGGSLGGLNVASLLRSAGWQVTVFERSPIPLDGAGAGIVVQEATVRHLVQDRGYSLDDLSCAAEIARVYGPGDEVLWEEPSHYRYTSWTTLYQALLEALGRENYVMGDPMVGLDQTEDSARVTLASGRVAEADLVVCADGVGSAARRILFGDVAQAYSGYVGWRGVTDVQRLPAPGRFVLPRSITYGIVPHSHIVAYPIPGSYGQANDTPEIVNYVWYRNVAESELGDLMTGVDGVRRQLAMQPSLVKPGHVAAMREGAKAELPSVLAELVLATRQPFLQVVVDMESPAMVAGRIALIGDAASVARPHAAAGTAKAAENGWALVEALDKANGDVVPALRDWEGGQLELARNLVERSRSMGDSAQFANSWTPGDPNLRFGLYGPGR